MNRRFRTTIALLLALSAHCEPAKVIVNPDDAGETLLGPRNPAERAEWLHAMHDWQRDERDRIHLTSTEYDRPTLAWTTHSYVQPQVMMEERTLYDTVTGRYTVDRFLDDVNRRYGGVDAVLLWAIYPNIGIDDRNQHDLLKDLPGGLPALKALIDDFHAHGVRVLLPGMPWDTGTRPEPTTLEDAIANTMRDTGADGMNGDTFSGIGHSFIESGARANYPFALEPEGHFEDPAMLSWNVMSWGYWAWWKTTPIPLVSRYKWVESRHMVNLCERWARDRTDQLQLALFNGLGYESWENIWGIWNEISPRDAHALRRIAAIERATTALLTSPHWQPHWPTEQPAVYASRFPGQGLTLFTLVNRSGNRLDGAQLDLPVSPGARYFDLWNGTELQPTIHDGQALLSFPIESRGYGAVLVTDTERSPDWLANLLAQSAQAAATPLASLATGFHALSQTLVPIAPAVVDASAPPPGMVYLPAADYRFRVSGIEIEGDDEPGVDVQYPWEPAPRRHHDHIVSIPALYMDRTPVTNAEYARFVSASGYRPRDTHNYLRDWVQGAPRPGWEQRPVTWVSLEDARAYAAWAGKRLPHEWEWQYAAQGLDGRQHPWGDAQTPERVPAAIESRTLRGPDPVDAHPAGASALGILDLTGNVWQWTDEYIDEHTRAAIIRGGSYYRPEGSLQHFTWYFPQEKQLNQHGKLLLMAPSKDRSGTIGFRCVVDARASAH